MDSMLLYLLFPSLFMIHEMEEIPSYALIYVLYG